MQPERAELGVRQTGAPSDLTVPLLGLGTSGEHTQCKRGHSFCSLIWSGNLRREMDFILPSTLPAGGIPWQKVLPPLLPRLNGTYGQYNWSPNLLIPETDNTSSAEVNCDDSGFTIQVDVKHFNPEDLMVKVIGDFVEVQGKHEEKKDGAGVTTRQFNRRYRIPKGSGHHGFGISGLSRWHPYHICTDATNRRLQNPDLIPLKPTTQISAIFTTYENKCDRSL